MKLTAKLAYSQVKINRSRTMWTLIGIILSTALITAVCSFVASGNAMIVGVWGDDYGGNAGRLTSLLLIPASILSGIIVAMSVIVISNAFRVSAGERTAQFGILKSVGATSRQITQTVMYESVFLSAVGIPVGIVIGLILAFTGVHVANHFLGEVNSLVHMMMNEVIIVLEFVIAWQALLAAAMMSFLTVLLSAWLPARKAAKVAAIDSIRGADEVELEEKQIRTSPLVGKLFGFEGVLAAKSMKRNKRNFRASVVSLTIGVVLFVNLSALSGIGGALERMMNLDVDATVVVDYASDRDTVINEKTGRRQAIIYAPIDSALAETISDRLSEYGGVSIFGAGSDMETYNAIVPREIISPEMMEISFYEEEQQEYETSAEIITVDRKNYAQLCEKAGVPVGSTILLNNHRYNNKGTLTDIVPFLYEEGEIQLILADGSIQETPIHGVLTVEDMPQELLPPNTRVVMLLVPSGDMRGYSWYVDTADLDGFMEHANGIMAEFFPQAEEASYMELGFSTRVFERQDYVKVMNIVVVLAMVFIYSFVVLLMLIGLSNVVSTMSTNVRMRSREFAMLQSVGMTYGGLKRMLNLESLMCTGKSLVFGIPIAILLTYLINMPVRAMLPVPYKLPWLAVLWCIVGVLAITWVTIRYSASRLRKRNIIESIRSEGGM